MKYVLILAMCALLAGCSSSRDVALPQIDRNAPAVSRAR